SSARVNAIAPAELPDEPPDERAVTIGAVSRAPDSCHSPEIFSSPGRSSAVGAGRAPTAISALVTRSGHAATGRRASTAGGARAGAAGVPAMAANITTSAATPGSDQRAQLLVVGHRLSGRVPSRNRQNNDDQPRDRLPGGDHKIPRPR